MKKPILAFALSFILPGAGLAYLGKWKWAAINIGTVLLLGVALVFCLPEEIFSRYIRYIAIGCSGGSGGLAQALAQQMNLKAQSVQQSAAADAASPGPRR
jgi:hypothetical protein